MAVGHRISFTSQDDQHDQREAEFSDIQKKWGSVKTVKQYYNYKGLGMRAWFRHEPFCGNETVDP